MTGQHGPESTSITVGDESFIFDYVKERDGGSLFRLPETDPEAEKEEIINEGDVEKMMALGTQRISHAELRGT